MYFNNEEERKHLERIYKKEVHIDPSETVGKIVKNSIYLTDTYRVLVFSDGSLFPVTSIEYRDKHRAMYDLTTYIIMSPETVDKYLSDSVDKEELKTYIKWMIR